MIKIARLKWLGHMVGMEDNIPGRKITFQPEGCRKKGRPKLRWLDLVFKNLKTLEVKVWWKKARARDLWSEVIKDASHTRGCSTKEFWGWRGQH
jgi:hypothetical protein